MLPSLAWLKCEVVPVDSALQPPGIVEFGAAVTVEDEDGMPKTYRITGDDEADADKVSWLSLLAKALFQARVGDLVIWQQPTGEIELKIELIN